MTGVSSSRKKKLHGQDPYSAGRCVPTAQSWYSPSEFNDTCINYFMAAIIGLNGLKMLKNMVKMRDKIAFVLDRCLFVLRRLLSFNVLYVCIVV